MHWISDLWHQLSDLEGLIRWGGYFVIAAIVFAETGLLLGFFLPGDSLLVTAGLLAGTGLLNIWLLGLLLMVAAIAGQSLGYAIGKAAGPRLFAREDSLLFKRSHLLRAHEFYEKHGGKTLIYAKFVPIVRTFAPFMAGVGRMQYPRFVSFNVIGGLGWVLSMTLAGYFLGAIPVIRANFEKVVLGIVFVSVAPMVVHYFRVRRAAS
jgi:membrane-associated protein